MCKLCGAEVVKAISAPLNACVKGFPTQEALHPFEKALLDLTIGLDAYQRRLSRVAAMRQACVEVRYAELSDTVISLIKSPALLADTCHLC